MKASLLVLLFLGALVATLVAMGVFDTGPDGPPPGPEPARTPDGEAAPPPALIAGEPETEPDPDFPALDRPVRILVVMRHRERFNALLAGQWGGQDMVRFRSFVQEPKPGDVVPSSPGEPPVPDPLDASALEGVDVVFLHGVNAAAVPGAFFEALAAKVKAGETGLLVQPGLLGGGILDQPAIGPLLPIAKVRPIEGQPVPGAFPEDAPFLPTKEGLSHPLSRIVAFPGWSERVWQGTRAGPRPWGTKFCYPVDAIKPGAVTLLEVEAPRAERFPAIVQGAPAVGRVVWVGVPDFGDNAYRDPISQRRVGSMTLWWIAYLAGQNP